MVASEWIIEGYLTKNIREGTSKAGKDYLIRTVSVYKGKNKDTGESLVEFVSFFVKPNDLDIFRSLPSGTKVQLKGRPEAKAYTNREGELVTQLQLNPAWEDWYQILEESKNDFGNQRFSGDMEEPF